jgi:hypothetical protein
MGMRLVAAVAAAAAALLALPVSAHASPSRPATCKLIKDATGDTGSPAPDGSLDAQLDITSADVATDNHFVTVVLRLDKLTAADPANPQGRIYEFDFTAKEKNFIVMGSLLPGGNDFEVFISDSRFEEGKSGARAATGIGKATGRVDTVHREVRISAPVSVFKNYAPMTRNTTIYYLVAFTYRANGLSYQGSGQGPSPVSVTGAFGLGVDEAWGHKAYYLAGNKSCVRPGY